jgi:hypothetical protein
MASNEFPLDYIFPKELVRIVNELERCLGFPKEFTASSMLFATSVAIGNNYKIRVKNGWEMTPSLYLVLVGSAGSSKSAPLKFAVQPFSERDKLSNLKFRKEMAQFISEKKMTEKERLDNSIIEMEEPKYRQYLVNDATMEAMFDILLSNPQGIGVYVDEWRDWYLNMNRYTKGDNKNKWITLWNGEDIIVNRKGSLPLRINKPFGSLAGTTQTDLLDSLTQGENAVSGFLDRFLICNPQNLLRKSTGDNELDPEVTVSWSSYINSILNLEQQVDEYGTMTSIILPYSKECKNARLEFENYIIGSQNQYSKTNPSKANYLSKVQTYTHRFALLFQVMSSVLEGEQLDNISIVSFMRARKVMDYFQNNMFAIFDFEKEKQLKKLCNNDIKYRWYKSLEQQFKTIDAKELLQSINETVEMGSHRDKKTIEAIDKNVTNWLQNDVLFTKLYHGMYEKNF